MSMHSRAWGDFTGKQVKELIRDPGDYIGRHRLSHNHSIKMIRTDGLGLVAGSFRINLRGGAFY